MKVCLLAIVLSVAVVGCNGKPEPAQVSTQPPTTIGRKIPLTQYKRATISVKSKQVQVYVADEQAERAEGLMFVKGDELGENEGMVFVFSNSEPLSFWMKNTMIPLDIAYLDASGKILNILQMQPLDESPHPSAGPAQYAVETHEGWFKRNGVRAGDKFDLSELSQ